jgi:hypothetical protein
VKVWATGSENMDNRKRKYEQQKVKVWATGSENIDNRK